MSTLPLGSQQTCPTSSFQAIETSLSQLPWRALGAAPPGCDHYFRLLHGPMKATKAWSCLLGTLELKTSLWGLNWEIQDTSVGRSSTLMRRRAGWQCKDPPLCSPLLQKETLHATASHWSGPICEGANIVDLHETWVSCRSMKCQALCLTIQHSLPLNANALVVVIINCSTVLMYVGPGPLESWTCLSKS